MKKNHLPLFVVAMVIITIGIWILQSGSENESIASKVTEILQVAIIVVLLLFGIIFGLKRFKSLKQGLPVEDELSTMIRQKAAAWSYYISIYVWLGALYLYHESNLGNVIIGGGILAMAILYGVFNLIFSKIGSHE